MNDYFIEQIVNVQKRYIETHPEVLADVNPIENFWNGKKDISSKIEMYVRNRINNLVELRKENVDLCFTPTVAFAMAEEGKEELTQFVCKEQKMSLEDLVQVSRPLSVTFMVPFYKVEKLSGSETVFNTSWFGCVYEGKLENPNSILKYVEIK